MTLSDLYISDFYRITEILLHSCFLNQKIISLHFFQQDIWIKLEGLPSDELMDHHIMLLTDFCHNFRFGQETSLNDLKSRLLIALTKCLVEENTSWWSGGGIFRLTIYQTGA